MRRLLLLAILATPLACAHHDTRSVAQRQSAKAPRGNLEAPPRDDRPDGLRRVEPPPIVTPPIP